MAHIDNKQEILERCLSRMTMIYHAMNAQHDWDEYGKYYMRILDSLDTIENSDIFSDDLRNTAQMLKNEIMSNTLNDETIEQLHQLLCHN